MLGTFVRSCGWLAGKSALLMFGAMIAAGSSATGSVFDQQEVAQQLTDAQRKELLAERDRLGNEFAEFHARGEIKSAIAAAEKYLAIERQLLGNVHADVAQLLAWIASRHEILEQFDRALEIHQEILAIRIKLHGERHWQATDARLALQHTEFLRKLSADQRARLREADRFATDCMSQERAGRFREALAAATGAHEIRETILGEEHPDTAASLNNLGVLYDNMGDYARAEPRYQRALEIKEKVLGEEHPDTATSLNNLGFLYWEMGDYARAEPLYQRALEIQEKVLGEERPDTATSLNNLGALYKAMDDYARAEPLLHRALEIHKKVLGEEHPATAGSLNNLGFLYVAMGDYARADPLARQALASYATIVDRTAAVQSERQQLVMTAQLRYTLDFYLSMRGRTSDELQAVYAPLLQWKGAVFLKQQRVLALRDAAQSDVETARLFERLERVSVQLATLAFATPTPAQVAARQRQIAEFTDEKEILERDLSARSAAFRALQQQSQLTVEQLQAALPATAALVDFLEYTHFEPPAEGKGKFVSQRRLAAFVVRRSGAVTLVDLGPVAEIGETIDKWRLSVRNRASLDRDDHPGHRLRKLVWEPLATHLSGAETILVSPDGALCQLPFGALPGEQPGTYLIEERAVAVIPVPQFLPQLLAARRPPTADDPQTNSLLLVGAVDYGGSPGAAGDLRSGESRALPDDWREDALPIWPRLTASKNEIDQVGESFQRHFAGATLNKLHEGDATESAFRQQAGRHRLLHLATHGFFAPARLKSALASDARDPTRSDLFSRQGISGHHPGLLSGLALSGANVKPQEGEDNGVLTAIEVQGMDLRGVDLVVLSACETGLGQVAGGEGVLGLQRAFQVAGARTVVASLWKVPDESTSLLMRRFYANLWERKLTPLEALREAQLWMLRGGKDPSAFAALPTNAKHRTPFTWAAFVLSGDWR